MGSMRVSSCIWCVFMSVVHPVAVLSAVFCVIRGLLMFVSDASGDHMVEHTRVWVLLWYCMLRVCPIISFCFHHVVDVSALYVVVCPLP